MAVRIKIPLLSWVADPGGTPAVSTATPVIRLSGVAPARQSLRTLTVKVPETLAMATLLQPTGVTGVPQAPAPASSVSQVAVATSWSNAHSIPASAA